MRYLVLLVLAAGCSGRPAPAPGGGEPRTIEVGEPIVPGACAGDLDCAFGYGCAGGVCVASDPDADNDGYAASVDCNDGLGAVSPGAAEACNGADENCNGAIDDGVLNACGACGAVPLELCDLVDNDCDGVIDDGCAAGSLVEAEPNHGFASCQFVPVPPGEGETITLTGTFNPAGDVDSYCFTITVETELTFDMNARAQGALTDGVFSLFDAGGAPLPGGFNDYADGADPFLRYTFTPPLVARLDTYHYDPSRGGTQYFYEIDVTAERLVPCHDDDANGLSNCDNDCDDGDALVFPGQTEVCDGADNDCDDSVDEGCPDPVVSEVEPNSLFSQCRTFPVPFSTRGTIRPSGDEDMYCFFAPAGARLGFDIDAKELGSPVNSRLRLYASPQDYFIFYIAQNEDGADPDTGYSALDSDSYLEHTFARPGIYGILVEDESLSANGLTHTYTLHARVVAMPPCTDEDGDGVTTCEGDCKDADPAVYFGALEICDLKDNNCDGTSDPSSCTGDYDGDGYTGRQSDCDDGDAARHPGAGESCNGLDDDCDGLTDEDVRNACGACGHPPRELCADAVDNDCDGVTDDDCDDDQDNDLVTPDGGDCDDGSAAVNPSAVEVCDQLDNDCDGLIDELVKNACGGCGPDPLEACDAIDNDCDGLIDDGAVNACGECGPTPVEVCDGADNNCDGDVDEGLRNACDLCGPLPDEVCDRQDNDCDGLTDEGCLADLDGDGQTPLGGDCDDNAPAIAWGAAELCGDSRDNNCNGYVNDVPPCNPQPETETNNALSQCNPVFWPGVVAGTITTASDVDSYCFTVDAGIKLGFDIDARSEGSPLDSYVELTTASGTFLRSNNNNFDPDTGTLNNADSYMNYDFDAAGTYVLRVRANGDAASAGTGAFYRLFIEPEGGCLDLDGDGVSSCAGDCNDYDSRVLPAATDVCDGVDNNCDGATDERCVGTCLDDLREPNDTFAQATVLSAGSLAELTYCGGDADFYALDAAAGTELRVDVLFAHAQVNLSAELYDTDGFTVLSSSASADDNETVMAVAPTSGRYYVRVFGALSAQGSYELVVSLTGP